MLQALSVLVRSKLPYSAIQSVLFDLQPGNRHGRRIVGEGAELGHRALLVARQPAEQGAILVVPPAVLAMSMGAVLKRWK